MNKSEDTLLIDKALELFQDKSGFLKATKENPFLKNKYMPYNEIVAKCRPILQENGLLVKQMIVHINEKGAIWTRLTHADSKQYYESVSPLTHKDNDPQSQGSAITYMKRYAYVAMLDLLVDADDDGNLANSIGAKADKIKTDGAVKQAIENIENSKNMEELKKIFGSLKQLALNPKVITAKDIKKQEFMESA